MRERNPQNSHQLIPIDIGRGSIVGGFVWEALEIAHTLDYIRELLHQPALGQLAHLTGHIPPLLVVLLGLALVLLQRRREGAVEPLNRGGEVREMRRERTTITTTTTIEREVEYRGRSS